MREGPHTCNGFKQVIFPIMAEHIPREYQFVFPRGAYERMGHWQVAFSYARYISGPGDIQVTRSQGRPGPGN